MIVTHDHRLRDIADRVLWLEVGRLTGEEPHLDYEYETLERSTA